MICLGWYSKAKKAKKLGRLGTRHVSNRVTHYRRGYRHARRINTKYDVVGLTPDHWISPIDFVPYVNIANKGYRGVKFVRTANKVRKSRKRKVRAVKGSYNRGSQRSRSRRSSSPNRRTSQSSRRNGSSRFYYYRGKRYERKYKQ